MTTCRRVAVTGHGVLAPQGNDPLTFFAALMAGQSGIGRLTADFADRLDCRIAAQVNFDPSAHFSKSDAASLDRVSQFAIVSARQALNASGLDLGALDRTRIGVSFGTGMAGAGSLDDAYARLYREGAKRLKPFTILMAMNSASASQIALELALAGPNLTYSTACSSSGVAIGEAMRLIRHGYADIMLAGGAEALLSEGSIRAWEALRTLAKEDESDPSASCKPFSANRSGLVLGEGAGMLVLEEWDGAVARGANILAELVGYGSSNDFSHITQPSVNGQAAAMRAALSDAGLAPESIGYINTHGTGTQMNDRVETAAIKQAFGEHAYQIPISSTKSMHGHLMGATSAVEFVICLEALRQQAVPPTQHLIMPDPECDLDYVPLLGRPVQGLEYVMSNSFAFGGTCAVLVARKVA